MKQPRWQLREMGLEVPRELLSRMTQYEGCEGGAGAALRSVLTRRDSGLQGMKWLVTLRSQEGESQKQKQYFYFPLRVGMGVSALRSLCTLYQS